ncbi:hypothetical protein PP756_gp61 [Pseudomonas phage VB_PaeP_VL1]|uniref:Uncharacterized protein n=1 Tax=Pseudomonas phage VB_PaeP_VL1 TaxID=2894395 RepID=A0AAE9CGG9_9CAUD|nr:hypothetical protein PP756_gp61 [Pseudomonas phage VB_PaeP_VL1]UGV19857.1 hypothetical protein vBPaePVL1_61 [Pseudomonas phage VB_PaeP_VL1]
MSDFFDSPHPVCNAQHPQGQPCVDCKKLHQMMPLKVKERVAQCDAAPLNRYQRPLPRTWKYLDVYRINMLFPLGELDPSGALDHARKKLMAPGQRSGGKSLWQDVKEARDTLNRWLEDNAGEDD